MEERVVINLIGEEYNAEYMGVPVATETKSKAYALLSNVSMTEITEGGRLGLNPECRFSLFFGDYNGQKIVEYADKRYTVYRAPKFGDTVVLYCEYRKGNSNG